MIHAQAHFQTLVVVGLARQPLLVVEGGAVCPCKLTVEHHAPKPNLVLGVAPDEAKDKLVLRAGVDGNKVGAGVGVIGLAPYKCGDEALLLPYVDVLVLTIGSLFPVWGREGAKGREMKGGRWSAQGAGDEKVVAELMLTSQGVVVQGTDTVSVQSRWENKRG